MITRRNWYKLFMLMLLIPLSCCTEEPICMADTEVTFTYTVPEEMFKYAEITICYNNGEQAEWKPMLENTFTLVYNFKQLPATAPVVLVYKKTNRPSYGVRVDWKITMDVKVTVEGKECTHKYTYAIDDDLGVILDSMISNPLSRTYAVKISKDKDIQFIN